jgi:hypothetical protein
MGPTEDPPEIRFRCFLTATNRSGGCHPPGPGHLDCPNQAYGHLPAQQTDTIGIMGVRWGALDHGYQRDVSGDPAGQMRVAASPLRPKPKSLKGPRVLRGKPAQKHGRLKTACQTLVRINI